MSRKALLIVDHDRNAIRRVRAELLTVTGQPIEGTTPGDAVVRLRIHEYSSVLLCGSLKASERSQLWVQISQQAIPPRVVCIGGSDQGRPYSHYTIFQPLQLPSIPAPEELARSLNLKPATTADDENQTAMSLRLVGKSEAVLDIRRMIERHSTSCTPVLILGEPGTGKRLIGRQIHDAAERQNGAFVSVNCAALAPDTALQMLAGDAGAGDAAGGKLAAARGGTLLLRNLAALPLDTQDALASILANAASHRDDPRATQAAPARIVATTNRDLRDSVERQQFSHRLYRLMAGFSIHVPPLRERLEDIPLMVAHVSCALRQRCGADIRFSPAAMRHLMHYQWPGNQQQLLSMLQKLAALRREREIDTADLPVSIRECAATRRRQPRPITPSPALVPGGPALNFRPEPVGTPRRRQLNRHEVAAKIAG